MFVVVVVVVETHLPRFEALAYVVPHFDEITRVPFIFPSICDLLNRPKPSSFRSFLLNFTLD